MIFREAERRRREAEPWKIVIGGRHRENLRINTVNRTVARIARPSAIGARPSRDFAFCRCFEIVREVVIECCSVAHTTRAGLPVGFASECVANPRYTSFSTD